VKNAFRLGHHFPVLVCKRPEVQENTMSKLLLGPLLAYAARLRFPTLFLIAMGLFVVDLIVPDVVPFVDEILLGLGTLLLSSWKKRPITPRP